MQTGKALSLKYSNENLSDKKLQEDWKSLVRWEENSPFRENEADVAQRRATSRWFWGVYCLVWLDPLVNFIQEDIYLEKRQKLKQALFIIFWFSI